MTRSWYDLLAVTPDASLDEIKRAFRREIAKYHPDKVQHLGQEFQDIAAVKAAELTQAYKTLSDESLRAEYNAQIAAGEVPNAASPGRAAPDAAKAANPTTAPRYETPAPEPARPSPPTPTPSQERAGVSDLVRKATVARFRQALDAELGRCDERPVEGFDVACVPPKGRFWSKIQPCVLSRFVAQVDAAAVAESWALALRMRKDEQRDVCLFLMGPTVASVTELARAIADARRRPVPGGGKLFLVPINAKTWTAHIPNDAPELVRAVVARLKSS